MISEQIWLLPNLAQHCQAFPSTDWHCWWLLAVLEVYLSVLKALMSQANALKNLPLATSSDININWIIVSEWWSVWLPLFTKVLHFNLECNMFLFQFIKQFWKQSNYVILEAKLWHICVKTTLLVSSVEWHSEQCLWSPDLSARCSSYQLAWSWSRHVGDNADNSSLTMLCLQLPTLGQLTHLQLRISQVSAACPVSGVQPRHCTLEMETNLRGDWSLIITFWIIWDSRVV